MIEAHDLGHPLIPEDENISNDVSIGNSQTIMIITGANMAGKSTFLRSLGVNLVLALSGSVVCAKSLHCPVINIRTGMRTADSLKEHQSYFYAELNRLKVIMEDLRSDKPLVILLDEILKGTNSTDKQLGSIALVKQLIPHPCLSVIATHDLALGELEQEYPNQIKNFCFEATIGNDKLSFDYKLRPGVAQKMNATYLMEKMGIIPSEKS
jgi:DNA mismatch repair ATPase MutS